MFMGTGSDVGKSLLVAGLCRHFANLGLRVRPFKPQNMSNNAAVTADGGEIGRAQALQARACRLPPSVHMNPVLLKPQSEIGSQVVVHGQRRGNANAREYQALKGSLLPRVLHSFERMKKDADLVLVEGAGSASEVNLRRGDIANWGFACASRTPVVLIGDIDRGGVIASIIGTHALIGEAERALLKGFLINKFRGDTSLFDEGIRIIRQYTDLISFGIAPFFCDAHKLPAEDALALDQQQASQARAKAKTGLKIVVLRTPRIANFDDLAPLIQEAGVAVRFLQAGEVLPGDADLVILAGSKATIADLQFVRTQGWDLDLAVHVRRGGSVLGLCGGYQMLGRSLEDPEGLEGAPNQVLGIVPDPVPGLGLLNVTTRLTPSKALTEVQGRHENTGERIRGYEMHMGRTEGPDRDRPYLRLESGPDGAQSPDGRVCGTYVHGLFSEDAFRRAFLKALGGSGSGLAFEAQVEATLDVLADHLASNLDTEALLEAAVL